MYFPALTSAIKNLPSRSVVTPFTKELSEAVMSFTAASINGSEFVASLTIPDITAARKDGANARNNDKRKVMRVKRVILSIRCKK